MWRGSGTFVSNPVVDGNTLFVLDGATNQLQARDLASGALQWTWQPQGSGETLPIGNLVLTRNLVFVGTSAGTQAIDRTTHQSVWSAPQSGALALSSNSVLYISDTGAGTAPTHTVTSYTLN